MSTRYLPDYPLTIPIGAFSGARPNTSYLLFCPDQGGWRVGEWQPAEPTGQWVAVLDLGLELVPSHVVAGPPPPISDTEIDVWMRRYGAPPLTGRPPSAGPG
jgi:hypothetical protein